MEQMLEQMAEDQNWAAVIINSNGVMLYNETSADAETGWKPVPEDVKMKYAATNTVVIINEEHLGSDATEKQARKMVELLRAEGYDASYGSGNSDSVPSNIWDRLLDEVAKQC